MTIISAFDVLSSPQVAGLSTRFRFGPPEDLLQQTSASHSDLGQLASQGGANNSLTNTMASQNVLLPIFLFCNYYCVGLGMYESPLFLAAHDEDGGGRSVPTTPLQVAAPGKTMLITIRWTFFLDLSTLGAGQQES